MISERKFASVFTSFWRETLPMEDGFIRFANVHALHFARPLYGGDAEDRGLVNEAAFRLFVGSRTSQGGGKPDIDAALSEARVLVSPLAGSGHGESSVSMTGRAVIVELARRLAHFFDKSGRYHSVTPLPHFSGCGILSDCHGDIIADRTIFEVKAGQRDFRAPDIRQVVTYCALNSETRGHDISNIGLINPRRGISYVISSEEFARAVARVCASELFGAIVDFLVAEGTSR
jgi:hypothetical protein